MTSLFRKYIDKNFSRSSMDTIDAANRIIVEYEEDGFAITLRQLHYQ